MLEEYELEQENNIERYTGTVIYVVMANVCYTLGWVVDTVWYNGNPRKRLYKSGLILAVILSALPGVWAVVAWLITVYTGRKLD